MPASAAAHGAPSPAAAPAQDRGAQAVVPVGSAPQGGAEGVPDAVRERIASEVKKQAERRSLAEEVNASRNMTSRVGFFDGSTAVFVDLLDARTQRALLRVFGPSDPPSGGVEPAQASEAYEAAAELADAHA